MPEDGKSLVRSERAPGRNFDYFEVPASMQVYVDGVNGFGLGPTVTRVEFYQIKKIKDAEGTDGQPLEVREQYLTLVLPTPAFAEFLANTIKGLKDNREALIQGTGEQAEGFVNFLRGLGGADDPQR